MDDVRLHGRISIRVSIAGQDHLPALFDRAAREIYGPLDGLSLVTGLEDPLAAISENDAEMIPVRFQAYGRMQVEAHIKGDGLVYL